MDFQKRLLHGVFSVNGIAKKIPRQVLHARAMYRIQTFVSAQVAGPAGSSQCGILALRTLGG